MTNPVIRVGIVEDNAFMRSTFENMIKGSSGCSLVGSYPNGTSAIEGLSSVASDVVLLDLTLNDISGLEVMSALREQQVSTRFLVCSVDDEGESIFRALASGADGYLLKTTEPPKVISAIRDVYRGEAALCSIVTRKLVSRIRKTVQPVREQFEGLSKRQEQILSLLLKGKLYKEIASDLYISVETVRKHVYNIYKKLSVGNRLEVYNKLMRKEHFLSD